MKYIIVQKRQEKEVALTKPSTRTQAVNSMVRFSSIGIENIHIRSTNKRNTVIIKDSAEEIQRAKRDFEALRE